jgi:hypothetical protein
LQVLIGLIDFFSIVPSSSPVPGEQGFGIVKALAPFSDSQETLTIR